ncbi:PAC2 family protein [Candidatus Woesearchaeota archaeon]|nr:PAC2 family protein [Candidatus Woesearchaeota archaeon]
MTSWNFEQLQKIPSLKNPVFIEGLPGIGNVGKIAADFLAEQLGAKKIYRLWSYAMPHSAFVNEHNIVEVPKIELCLASTPHGDVLILLGDVQPMDEASTYEFTFKMLELCKQYGVKDIITLGGIGLQQIPKKPKVYCASNRPHTIQKYKHPNLDKQLYGVVGPIIGVTGLMVGLAGKYNLDATAFLAETYGHPMYLGMRGAKEILSVLEHHYQFGVDLKRFDLEIEEMERVLKDKTKSMQDHQKMRRAGKFKLPDTAYIG